MKGTILRVYQGNTKQNKIVIKNYNNRVSDFNQIIKINVLNDCYTQIAKSIIDKKNHTTSYY